MEKKIKYLYILSIVAILAFLGMQVYWLYGRYEYSLTEYENRTGQLVAEALKEYDKTRAHGSATEGDTVKVQSWFQMSHGVDSVGKQVRTVTVRTNVINGRKLLGIAENRKLTPEEMKRLEEMVMDSLEMIDAKIGTIDASSAPSDGIAWNAMKNFESEVQSPFTSFNLAALVDSVIKSITVPSAKDVVFENTVPEYFEISADRSHLMNIQTEILAILAKNVGKVVDRDTILNTVSGDSSYANSLALNVQITYIRKLLTDHSITITSLKKKGLILMIQ